MYIHALLKKRFGDSEFNVYICAKYYAQISVMKRIIIN